VFPSFQLCPRDKFFFSGFLFFLPPRERSIFQTKDLFQQFTRRTPPLLFFFPFPFQGGGGGGGFFSFLPRPRHKERASFPQFPQSLLLFFFVRVMRSFLFPSPRRISSAFRLVFGGGGSLFSLAAPAASPSFSVMKLSFFFFCRRPFPRELFRFFPERRVPFPSPRQGLFLRLPVFQLFFPR